MARVAIVQQPTGRMVDSATGAITYHGHCIDNLHILESVCCSGCTVLPSATHRLIAPHLREWYTANADAPRDVVMDGGERTESVTEIVLNAHYNTVVRAYGYVFPGGASSVDSPS